MIDKIKIVSSNIRFDNPADLDNSWNNRKKILSDDFNSRSLDIICTQEGRETQLRELEGLLSEFKLQDSHRSWIDNRMYPCIFTRALSSKQSNDFWLSKTPAKAGSISFNSAFPRLCTWAKLVIEGNEILVFNMHLDHTTDDVRENQINVAIDEIKTINKECLPLIVCGDFNSGPNSNIYKTLIHRLDLLDPWTEHQLAEESTYHLFRGEFLEGKRIDWILHSKEFTSKKIELIKTNKNNIYISDHFPVYAELDLKKGY